MYVDILEESKSRVLVAAHRGVSGANIPCNTIPSFDIALRSGADIIEMDLFKSTDGGLFIFHTGKEPSQLNKHIDVTQMTSSEIKKLRYTNVDFYETPYGIESFDDVLEHLKNKCILNLDRFADIIPEVTAAVEKHGMREQILLKTAPEREILKKIEAFAPKYMYMPIYMETDTASEVIRGMDINFIGAELVFETENSPVASDAYIASMLRDGKVLWGNGIVYSSDIPLAAGYNDDISVTRSPDDGWGRLIDKGFKIIQTDWALQLSEYLKSKSE